MLIIYAILTFCAPNTCTTQILLQNVISLLQGFFYLQRAEKEQFTPSPTTELDQKWILGMNVGCKIVEENSKVGKSDPQRKNNYVYCAQDLGITGLEKRTGWIHNVLVQFVTC